MKVLPLKKDLGEHDPLDVFAGGGKGNAILAPRGTKASGSSGTGVAFRCPSGSAVLEAGLGPIRRASSCSRGLQAGTGQRAEQGVRLRVGRAPLPGKWKQRLGAERTPVLPSAEPPVAESLPGSGGGSPSSLSLPEAKCC